MKTKLIAAMCVLVLTGCKSMQHPATVNLSPEAKTAVAGRQLIAAVSSGADGIDRLISASLIPQAEGVAVLQVLRRIGVESGRLADVLLLVDQAKTAIDKQTALLQAAAIIRTINRGLMDALVPIGTPTGREHVAAVLRIISDALVVVSRFVPATPVSRLNAWRGQVPAVAFRPVFSL